MFSPFSNSIKRFLFAMLIAVVLLPVLIPAEKAAAETLTYEEPVLYYFWGHCPVCSKPEDHVGLFNNYPLEVQIYEVFHDPDGRQVYDRISDELEIETYGFPTIVFNNRYWLGFSETVQADLLEEIDNYLAGQSRTEFQNILVIPLLGEVNLMSSPLLLTTAIIATLDGFNPCSLFVLTFLLAIIVHSASRKRIFLVGITFLLVTSFVYGLFMLGVLNIMLFASQLFWIRNIISAIVIILGLIAIKDFLFFKEGVSVVIPESYKKKYYKQVRSVFYKDGLFPTIAATTVMALGIALVELPCTAGFPFIWSSIVSNADLGPVYFIALFLLYIFLYLLIELIIFGIAVIRMQSIKITEEKGRLLKLIAGSLMLTMGLILLAKPEYMENITGVLLTFGLSFTLVLLIYYSRLLVKNGKER